MILDVGCGLAKRGDIGVDTVKYPSVDYQIDLEKEPLPFSDGSFRLVVSYHFLEHVSNPEKVLCELVRVAESRLVVVVPHRYGLWAKQKSGSHKVTFNKAWFLAFARKYRLECRVGYTFLPFLFVFSRVHELYVELWKVATSRGHKSIPLDISDRELDQVLLGDLDYWINYYTTTQHDIDQVNRLIMLRKKRLDRLHFPIGWDNR